ncbi:MAG: hypothetical protein ACREJC_22195 [Tepidisphaeraceae bacterium]
MTTRREWIAMLVYVLVLSALTLWLSWPLIVAPEQRIERAR